MSDVELVRKALNLLYQNAWATESGEALDRIEAELARLREDRDDLIRSAKEKHNDLMGLREALEEIARGTLQPQEMGWVDVLRSPTIARNALKGTT